MTNNEHKSHKRTKMDREIVAIEAENANKIDASNIEAMIAYAKHMIEKFPFSYFSILKGRRFSNIWNVILEKHNFLMSISSQMLQRESTISSSSLIISIFVRHVDSHIHSRLEQAAISLQTTTIVTHFVLNKIQK